jgi:hypothetical protein
MKSIESIKELIELMRSTKTEYIKVGTTEIKLSQLALIESSDIQDLGAPIRSDKEDLDGAEKVMNTGRETFPDSPSTQPEDDELLYYSVK